MGVNGRQPLNRNRHQQGGDGLIILAGIFLYEVTEP